ncbi:MAG: aminotransferase class III-fold pyridoxal phosphate-dependent enzyme [Saprospiraceae bacterium]
MYLRRQFLENIAGTSDIPQAFCPVKGSGSYLYDIDGRAFLDLISGFCVNNLGHSHPAIVEAIQEQSSKYLHTNVYGEHIQLPQVQLAQFLCSLLPSNLQSIYYLNSGSEVIDAAIKLSRKATGRSEIIVCSNAYHGSTLAAESLRSDFEHSAAYRPLLPNIRFIQANNLKDLEKISKNTAAVITEVVQAEAGVKILNNEFLKGLRDKCTETNSLLVFDEIQTGFGRTGSLFAFQKTAVIPDILLVGKSFGFGLPLSGLVTSKELFDEFKNNPSLGYLSTFGGNPLCCATAFAGLKALLAEKIMDGIPNLVKVVKEELTSPLIKEIRAQGMLIAIDLGNKELVWKLIQELFNKNLLVESFLFDHGSLRLTPPLNIKEDELRQACRIINEQIIKSSEVK